MKAIKLAAIMLLTLILASCDDTTETIGTSLTDNMDNLKITTDTFTVTTRSIVADSVYSRNTTGYLGRIKDPETGAYISGDFMVQFHTLEDYHFPEKDSIISVDAQNEIIADSCEIRLFYDSFYGDSLAPMKAVAYEMGTPMEEGVKYYSNYDPIAEGYVRTDGIKEQKTYTLTDLTVGDSLRSTSDYTPYIRIPLNNPYTDKDGTTYNNYGTYLMRKYFQNPDNFKNSYNLIHHVCPGFYIKVTDGIGNMAYISSSQLALYFKFKGDSSTYVGTTVLAGTEEVLQTTTIKNDRERITSLSADNTCTYLKTPAGIFTELTIPVDDITLNHQNDTLNSARITLTRINNETHSDYALDSPSTLLMVERDSMYTFFEKGKIADNTQSYLTTASSNTYTFNNISGIIHHMAKIKEEGMKANSQWTAEHPNWNKVVLIPVTANYITVTVSYSETAEVLTSVSHDMSLKSTRLVGGSKNPYDDIKLSVIYSKFSNK